jgi:hypothetical protein
MEPFRPRTVRSHGVHAVSGWKVKLYSISHDGSPLRWNEFQEGFRMARALLPQPPSTPGRPGIAFAIAHHGKTADYAVLAWWDRENELPIRVFVRPPSAGARWRPARESESVCVWDLEIIWEEREAYVETMLAKNGAARQKEYVDRFMSGAKVEWDVPPGIL